MVTLPGKADCQAYKSNVTSIISDITDHLQLLLRKSGYYLHTSAEKEVVRTIKEKTCYLALNPAKEEKDNGGAWEEFRLPDGKVMQVRMALTQISYDRTHDEPARSGEILGA